MPALDTSTPVTLGLILAVVVLLGPAVATYFTVRDIKKQMGRSWDVRHQKVWVDKLQNQNPSLEVPSAESVIEIFNGKSAD